MATPDTTALKHPVPSTPLLIVLSLAQFMLLLDFTVVNVALPSVQRDLDIAPATAQWLISGYSVTFGGLLLLGGRLADTLGAARCFRIGVVLFTVASISGGCAVEPVLLLASRAVQGVGAALVAPAGLALIVTTWAAGEPRARALGVFGAVVATGYAAGAILGGLLVQVDWRLIFFINVPVAAVLLLGAHRLLPHGEPTTHGSFDLVGAIAVTVGVALLVLGISEIGSSDARVLAVAAVVLAVVVLAGFVLREKRATNPILDLALVRDRGVAGANVVVFFFGGAVAAQALVMTLYLQLSRDFDPIMTGLCFIPQAAGSFAVASPVTVHIPALGPRRAAGIGMVVLVLALLAAAVTIDRDQLPALLVATFVVGAATKFTMTSLTLAATSGAAAATAEGSASALLSATRQVGGAVGIAIVAAVIASSAAHTAGHFAVAAAVTTGIAAVAVLGVGLLPGRARRDTGARRPLDTFFRHCGGIA